MPACFTPTRSGAWLLGGLAGLSLLLLLCRSVEAYPTMLRHGYTKCGQCHVDPSGAGLLKPYGRLQGELLLARGGSQTEEGGRAVEPFWGMLPASERFLTGGNVRAGVLNARSLAAGAGPSDTRFLQMATEASAAVLWGRVRASASVGYAHQGARPAAITRSDGDNLISREHWAGFVLDDDEAWVLRAGRIRLPFGLRNVEHTSWVRAATRTDINQSQQHGAALAFAGEIWRAEVMVVVGNLQVRPDRYRDRGMVGHIERAVGTTATVGLSSQILRAERDLYQGVGLLRQAHSLDFRWTPHPSLVLMGEGAVLGEQARESTQDWGVAIFMQADWALSQGLHLAATAEGFEPPAEGGRSQVGGWLTLDLFPVGHTELRIDTIVRGPFSSASAEGRTLALLAQFHIYL